MSIKRPRVAAIGLEDPQAKSIEHLCGTLRSAVSFSRYVNRYNVSETDIMVFGTEVGFEVDQGAPAHLLTMGLTSLSWMQASGKGVGRCDVSTTTLNTERELTVPVACPAVYETLAADLSKQLGSAEDPPPVVIPLSLDGFPQNALVSTTSGHAVALRLAVPTQASGGRDPNSVVLVVPEVANLSAWFAAFLSDIHETDPERVPQPPPRLSNPGDWHTPQERALAAEVAVIEDKIERLDDERDRRKTELAAEEERTNKGIRRAVWADGEDLVEAVAEILDDLGFTVHPMDAGLDQGEPKREDLRLTHEDRVGWEAIVEVKGYTGGTRTTDARQIREHRDRYISDRQREPDLTLWVANPHRRADPSFRPTPDGNVKHTAEITGIVHALATDLYMQWLQFASGSLEADQVSQSLTNAAPGLWAP